VTRRGWWLFLALSVIWGIPYLLIRVAVGELTPASIVFLRTTIGTLLLLPAVLKSGRLRTLLPRWRAILLFTLVEVALPWWLLADAERRIAAACEQHNVGWTILRPTLIYAEGRDTNITPLSRLIRRFGFMPLVGGAPGLRQPVHAEDLAIGAIAAATSAAAVNKVYALAGGETLAYREMIGRIFDGMRLPRRTISVPPLLWRAGFMLAKPLFPGANVAMGTRMMKDMTFDCTPAIRDLGWKPRAFNPVPNNQRHSIP